MAHPESNWYYWQGFACTFVDGARLNAPKSILQTILFLCRLRRLWSVPASYGRVRFLEEQDLGMTNRHIERTWGNCCERTSAVECLEDCNGRSPIVSQYRLFRVCLKLSCFSFLRNLWILCCYCSYGSVCVKTRERGHSVPYIYMIYVCIHNTYHRCIYIWHPFNFFLFFTFGTYAVFAFLLEGVVVMA
jgi:hypothetical protein